MSKKRNLKGLLVAIALMLTATGCGSSYDTTYDEGYYTNSYAVETSAVSEEYDYGFNLSDSKSYETDTEVESPVDITGSTTSDTVQLYEEKLIYTGSLTIETLNYEDTIAGIKELASKYKAIISSENESDSYYDWYSSTSRRGSNTRHDEICLRVPSKSYFTFMDEIGTVGTIREKSQSVENITNSYYDVQTQIASLRKQEERLLEMYDSCETIEDMIAVEKRLSSVQAELSSYQSQLNYMDMDVAYSYVYLYVNEVVEIVDKPEPIRTNTFKDRLMNTLSETWQSFLQGLEDLLFGIIRNIVLIIILVVVVIIFRKKIAEFFKNINKKAKKEKLEEKLEESVNKEQDK